MEQVESQEVAGELSLSTEILMTEDDKFNEMKHFQHVVNVFYNYKKYEFRKLCKSTKYISSLPSYQQQLLKGHRNLLFLVHGAIQVNYATLQLILKDVKNIFKDTNMFQDIFQIDSAFVCTEGDMDKVHSVLKQLHREWSSEGKEERDAAYKQILDEISERYPDPKNTSILIPGAGLGRLPFELARRGYECQGNEFSLYMLFVSNFILNKCQGTNLYQVYPWLHQSHNHMSPESRLGSFRFPDVDPSHLPEDSHFSMAAGNFVEIYKNEKSWDSIATCFFLDTAPNVITYIETIWNILKPGGCWINFGPLLYHHADIPDVDSIELCYDEIRNIIVEFGFKILKEKTGLPAPYCQNPKSMMGFVYKCVFFVCEKPHF